MIAFRSHASDGSSFQVYDDDTLIGHIRRQSSLNGDKFIAVIDVNGEKGAVIRYLTALMKLYSGLRKKDEMIFQYCRRVLIHDRIPILK